MEMVIDTSEVEKALAGLAKDLVPTLTDELNKVSNEIVVEAKNNHRFKSRTGNLVEATKKELKIDRESIRALYKIDNLKAPYGGYIHDGKKGWSADKYLENAVNRNEEKIMQALSRGTDKAIAKAGLQ